MAYEIQNYSVTVGGPRRMKYPIRELQVGQSFCVPAEEERAIRAAAAYVNARFHKWGIYVSVQRGADGNLWCGRCDVPTKVTIYRPKSER